ncbi:CBS domain-containing protein [Pyrodictium abyssi]|uniref:CBS domain-containing protein n=1 Tax=Pyrodictium abyssi TaxID=54256 RepID=A0ABN6ZUG4_9CREN|nr:CBS domain-containing protein [Pyrodictium abyssi]
MILLLRRRRIPLRARDVMTSPPVTIDPNATIKDVARKMREERVGSVLVVDEEGRLRGIITEHDLVFACSEGWDPNTKQAWEIMTEDPITVKPDEDIVVVIKKMRDANIRHIPVVGEDGKPLGMISARDILDFVMTLAGLGIIHEFARD